MARINNYSIDIARDPAKAIQRICDPILAVLNAQVDATTEELKGNLAAKKQLRQAAIDCKNQVFEEKARQVNLRREREEIAEGFAALREDIEVVQAQAVENAKRKSGLIEQITESTERFRAEAHELREELHRVQEKLVNVHKHKAAVEDQALFLLNDRGSADSKYRQSISEFLALARDLARQADSVQDRVLKLDAELSIDPLYKGDAGREQFEAFYRKDRIDEKEKKAALMKDLAAKQQHILGEL